MRQDLPPLREDLGLTRAAAGADGLPGWTLFDPVRNRYFALDSTALRLLRAWNLGNPARVLAAAAAGGEPVSVQDLRDLLAFLADNDLLVVDDAPAREALSARAAARRSGGWRRHVPEFLFLRVPLGRPDRFLTATWPYVAPLASRTALWVILALGLIGLFLAGRDWDRFAAEAAAFATPGGAILFALTLLATKSLHELGHAYAAKRHGLGVPAFGVAFLVFVPVLYTDVSDAWRLPTRRARLEVGAAGIVVELALACLATLAWSLLPPGGVRDAAFLLATATWLITLVVNLNPLMRFDGYFLLADLLRVENLQARAFALGRWRLREALFAYGDAPPETLPPRLHRTLLVWCYAAWMWRLVVFVAIAFAVYHLLFKALGLAVLVFELVWFVGRPIAGELAVWAKRRGDTRFHPRQIALGLTALGGLVLACVPWPLGIEVPARQEATLASPLHAPVPARIVEVRVRDGQAVAEGDVLYQLAAPDLDHQILRLRHRIASAQRLLQRQAANPGTAARAGVLEQELAADLAAWRGLMEQAARLSVRAPHAGTVRDVARGLHAGRWIAPDLRLARVVAGPARIEGYAEASDMLRLAPGLTGRFVPDDPAQPARTVALARIAPAAAATVTLEGLASVHRGPVPAQRNPDGEIVPSRAIWGVGFDLTSPEAPAATAQGVVRIDLPGEAPILWLWRRVAALVIRESGF